MKKEILWFCVFLIGGIVGIGATSWSYKNQPPAEPRKVGMMEIMGTSHEVWQAGACLVFATKMDNGRPSFYFACRQ